MIRALTVVAGGMAFVAATPVHCQSYAVGVALLGVGSYLIRAGRQWYADGVDVGYGAGWKDGIKRGNREALLQAAEYIDHLRADPQAPVDAQPQPPTLHE